MAKQDKDLAQKKIEFIVHVWSSDFKDRAPKSRYFLYDYVQSKHPDFVCNSAILSEAQKILRDTIKGSKGDFDSILPIHVLESKVHEFVMELRDHFISEAIQLRQSEVSSLVSDINLLKNRVDTQESVIAYYERQYQDSARENERLKNELEALKAKINSSASNSSPEIAEQVNHEAPKADHEASPESLDDAATKQATIKRPSKRTAKAKKQAPSKEATKATDNAGNEPLNDADKGILQPQSMEGAGDAMEAIKQDESYQALSSEEPSTPVAKSSKTAKTTKSNSRAKKSTKQEPSKKQSQAI